MKALTVKDLDENLLRRVKISVATSGVSMRQWIIDAFELKLGKPLAQGGRQNAAAGKKKDMRLGPCEGCGNPSDHMDAEGIPVCTPCWKALIIENGRKGKVAAGKGK